MNKNMLEVINEYIDSHRSDILKDWQDLVNLESGSADIENVNKVGEWLKSKFETEGFECKLVQNKANAKSLVGILGAERPNKPILFSGHFDTVFKTGTILERPFTIEDGKAYGPGVLDMKGGIVISLYVIKALNASGFNSHPLKILFAGDEEIAHANSTSSEFIVKESKDCLFAFNMETGLVDNSLCIGRKGGMGVEVNVQGIQAHAGNDFTSGRNAIEEMAFKILRIREITDLKEGITISTGHIIGGTVANVIPNECTIQIDCRFVRPSQLDIIKEKLFNILEETTIDGTTTTYTVKYVMDAFETTDNVLTFFEFAKKVAQENDFEELKSTTLGGSSDASYITIAGTPILCSFGVKGEWNHTTREYAIVDSMFERAKLISAIVLNADNF